MRTQIDAVNGVGRQKKTPGEVPANTQNQDEFKTSEKFRPSSVTPWLTWGV